MKSLRKFNFFRHNKHPKEDKENHQHDESPQIRFSEQKQSIVQFEQPQKKILKRRNSIERFDHINPYDSAKAKPRVHRPVQSCVGKVTGNGYASSSDDDDVSTLVAERTKYQKPRQSNNHLAILQQSYKKRQTNFSDIQTSSEYGSGDPSPTNKHVAFESHHYDIEYSHGSDYWKNKYRHYKDLCKKISAENSKLRDRNNFYEEKYDHYRNLDIEIAILQKEKIELQTQIRLLNSKLQTYERNQTYMHHLPSAYPLFPPLLSHNHHQFNNQQQHQHGGAGEKLASHSRMPDYSSAVADAFLPPHGNGNIFPEEDETKNFRVALNGSSSDDPFPLNNSSYLSSTSEEANGGIERGRCEMKIELSPLRHDRSASLTILQDDGYSSHGTTQSNQALTTAGNDELKVFTDSECLKTPVKKLRPILKQRIRYLSN
jgi:hypothetical protein